MDPLLLQKQLKENATDLQDFYKELQEWGEEMKRKDESLMKSPPPPVTDQKTKKIPETKKLKTDKKPKVSGPQKKIGLTDYSAWDKFDADAECAKVDYDENDESELTDECDETARDQAFVEKEKGNKFVKEKKWEEAIECYTKAIDFYAFDPVFYANRALCFLKINNMVKAESDCTMSLKLDGNYVKAYQRRAVAREALNQLKAAEDDLLKVLEIEPKNKESQKALDDLRKKLKQIKQDDGSEKRPISKFAASRLQKKSQIPPLVSENQIIDDNKPTTQWNLNDDNILLVKSVNKPPHLRSKKPLKRIEIKEIDSLANGIKSKIENENKSKIPVAFGDKIIERRQPTTNNKSGVVNNNSNNNNNQIRDNIEMKAPKSSVQFYSTWKHLKNIELKYNYLKLIKPNEIPIIFKESLDSDLISEILNVLINYFIPNNDEIYEFLYNLTQVRRFSTFTIFMTQADKTNIWKLIDYIKENENKEREIVDQLIKAFEL